MRITVEFASLEEARAHIVGFATTEPGTRVVIPGSTVATDQTSPASATQSAAATPKAARTTKPKADAPAVQTVKPEDPATATPVEQAKPEPAAVQMGEPAAVAAEPAATPSTSKVPEHGSATPSPSNGPEHGSATAASKASGDAPVLTYQDVYAAASSVAAKAGIDKLRALLSTHGLAKISEAQERPDLWAALIADATSLIA